MQMLVLIQAPILQVTLTLVLTTAVGGDDQPPEEEPTLMDQ